MKIINYIIGALVLLYEILEYLSIRTKDFLFSLFQKNRNNNSFIELITRNSFLNITIVMLLTFVILGHYSVLVSIPLAIILGIRFSFFRGDNYKKFHIDDYDESADIFGFIMSLTIIAVFLIVENANTPYHYDEVGKITLKKEDVNPKEVFNDVKIIINNKVKSVDVTGCKTGTYKVYKRHLPIGETSLTYNIFNYIAQCSKNMKIVKNLEKL